MRVVPEPRPFVPKSFVDWSKEGAGSRGGGDAAAAAEGGSGIDDDDSDGSVSDVSDMSELEGALGAADERALAAVAREAAAAAVAAGEIDALEIIAPGPGAASGAGGTPGQQQPRSASLAGAGWGEEEAAAVVTMADGIRLPQRRVRHVRHTTQLWPPPRARGGEADGRLHVVECVVPRRASAALAAASPCTYYRLGEGGVSAPYTGHDGGLDLERAVMDATLSKGTAAPVGREVTIPTEVRMTCPCDAVFRLMALPGRTLRAYVAAPDLWPYGGVGVEVQVAAAADGRVLGVWAALALREQVWLVPQPSRRTRRRRERRAARAAAAATAAAAAAAAAARKAEVTAARGAALAAAAEARRTGQRRRSSQGDIQQIDELPETTDEAELAPGQRQGGGEEQQGGSRGGTAAAAARAAWQWCRRSSCRRWAVRQLERGAEWAQKRLRPPRPPRRKLLHDRLWIQAAAQKDVGGQQRIFDGGQGAGGRLLRGARGTTGLVGTFVTLHAPDVLSLRSSCLVLTTAMAGGGSGGGGGGCGGCGGGRLPLARWRQWRRRQWRRFARWAGVRYRSVVTTHSAVMYVEAAGARVVVPLLWKGAASWEEKHKGHVR